MQTTVLTGDPTSGVIATAAPILVPLQPTNQQLILGLKDTNESFVEMGSFDSNFVYHHGSITNLNNELGGTQAELLNLKAGNFDNQNSDGTHNPGVQLETYTYESPVESHPRDSVQHR